MLPNRTGSSPPDCSTPVAHLGPETSSPSLACLDHMMERRVPPVVGCGDIGPIPDQQINYDFPGSVQGALFHHVLRGDICPGLQQHPCNRHRLCIHRNVQRGLFWASTFAPAWRKSSIPYKRPVAVSTCSKVLFSDSRQSISTSATTNTCSTVTAAICYAGCPNLPGLSTNDNSASIFTMPAFPTGAAMCVAVSPRPSRPHSPCPTVPRDAAILSQIRVGDTRQQTAPRIAEGTHQAHRSALNEANLVAMGRVALEVGARGWRSCGCLSRRRLRYSGGKAPRGTLT